MFYDDLLGRSRFSFDLNEWNVFSSRRKWCIKSCKTFVMPAFCLLTSVDSGFELDHTTAETDQEDVMEVWEQWPGPDVPDHRFVKYLLQLGDKEAISNENSLTVEVGFIPSLRRCLCYQAAFSSAPVPTWMCNSSPVSLWTAWVKFVSSLNTQSGYWS